MSFERNATSFILTWEPVSTYHTMKISNACSHCHVAFFVSNKQGIKAASSIKWMLSVIKVLECLKENEDTQV